MSNDAASCGFTRSISPRSAPVMIKSSTYIKIVKDVVRKQVEHRNQKERNAGLMEAWSHAQYAGETERERENTENSITKNDLTQCLYKCVCSMHTFYTSPYKD